MRTRKKAIANNGIEYNVKKWLSNTTFRDERGIIRSIAEKKPEPQKKTKPKARKKPTPPTAKPEKIYRRGNRYISSKTGFVSKDKYASYVKKILTEAYKNADNKSEKPLVNQSLKTSIFENVSKGRLTVLNVEGHKIIVDKNNIEKVNKLIDDILKSYYDSAEAKDKKKRDSYHVLVTKEIEYEDFIELDLDSLLDNEFLPDETIEEIFTLLNNFAND
jgi:hypothetical protein